MKELKEWLAALLIVLFLIAMFSIWIDSVEKKRHEYELQISQTKTEIKIKEKKSKISDSQKYFDKLLFNS